MADTFAFACAGCKEEIQTRLALRGSALKCPYCGRQQTIPYTGLATRPDAAALAPEPAAAADPVKDFLHASGVIRGAFFAFGCVMYLGAFLFLVCGIIVIVNAPDTGNKIASGLLMILGVAGGATLGYLSIAVGDWLHGFSQLHSEHARARTGAS